MNFTHGFSKVAKSKEKGILDTAGKWLGKAKDVGGGLAGGAKESLKDSIEKHLGLGGLKEIPNSVKQHGGVLNALKTKKGRGDLGRGIGKAAPSLAAGAAYTYGAKKVYDKTLGSQDGSKDQSNYNYLNNYVV
jgi:hypothetical protein